MPKDTIWTGAVDTSFNTAGNWSNGVPVSGDGIYFTQQASRSLLTDVNQGSLNPAIVRVGPAFNQAIGSATAPLIFGAPTATMKIDARGSLGVWINPGTISILQIYGGPASPNGVVITGGTITTGYIYGGAGVRLTGGTWATIDVGHIGSPSTDVILQIDAAVSWTTLNGRGGQITLLKGGATLNLRGSSVWHQGTGSGADITTLNMESGTFYFSAAGATIGTINAHGGVLDCSLEGSAKTITTLNLYVNAYADLVNGPDTVNITTFNLYGGRWRGTKAPTTIIIPSLGTI